MRVPMGLPIITPMQKKASRKANLDFNEIIKELKVQKTWPSLYFHLLHQPNSCSPVRKKDLYLSGDGILQMLQ